MILSARDSPTTCEQGSAYCDVIDPDFVCTIQGDSVASPNIFRIQARDGNVLNDDILCGV
jgi:hypothetical protein